MNKTGIDLNKFEKYITKGYGKACKDWCRDCVVCRTWRLYSDLADWVDTNAYLDEPIKKHKSRK